MWILLEKFLALLHTRTLLVHLLTYISHGMKPSEYLTLLLLLTFRCSSLRELAVLALVPENPTSLKPEVTPPPRQKKKIKVKPTTKTPTLLGAHWDNPRDQQSTDFQDICTAPLQSTRNKKQANKPRMIHLHKIMNA